MYLPLSTVSIGEIKVYFEENTQRKYIDCEATRNEQRQR